MSDGRGGVATGLVTVTVAAPVNHPPVAVSESIGTPPNVAITFQPMANDSDPDGDEIIILNASATHGAVTVSGSSITYTPTVGFAGAASITYTIGDAHGLTATAVDPVNVAYGAGPNHAPTAAHDVTTITQNTTLSNFNVLANDTDVDGDTLTITSKTNGQAGGVVTINSPATTLNYVPPANWTGTDEFTYTIGDGRGGSSTGVVDVVVQAPANNPPVAKPLFASTMGGTAVTISILADDYDPDGDAIITTGNTSSPHATIFRHQQDFLYQPTTGFSGTDTFQYTIQDIYGARASNTITVTVNNNPPYAPAFGANIGYNTPLTFDPRQGGVTDIDGQAISVVSVTQPPGGAGSTQLSGNLITYTPPSGFSGTATFNFTVADTVGATYTAAAAITVSPPSQISVSAGATTWSGGRFLNGQSTTTTVGVNVSGGSGSYTYSWVRVSGDTKTTATLPGTAATAFYYSGTVVGDHLSTWKCVVTDTVTGLSGETALISVDYNYDNGA